MFNNGSGQNQRQILEFWLKILIRICDFDSSIFLVIQQTGDCIQFQQFLPIDARKKDRTNQRNQVCVYFEKAKINTYHLFRFFLHWIIIVAAGIRSLNGCYTLANKHTAGMRSFDAHNNPFRGGRSHYVMAVLGVQYEKPLEVICIFALSGVGSVATRILEWKVKIHQHLLNKS